MQRPDVRIIQPQTQEITADVSGYEADALLAKYGFKQGNLVQPSNPDNGMTFEEMVRKEEEKMASQLNNRNRPRAITFDDSRTNYAESKWSSLEDETGMNIGIQVTIVSDQRF